MKKLNVFLFVSLLILFSSCSPKISTSILKNYPSLDYKTEVIVLGMDQSAPEDAELLGQVKVGDTGFSTNCSYEIVIDKIKLEAKKVGGNVVKITKHLLPSAMSSTCHRITAKIFRVENIENLSNETDKEVLLDADYAIINVYRYGGVGALINYDLHLGDSVICRVKNNFKTTIQIKKDGLNTLWARTESKSEVPINIKIGKVYYLRCGIKMGAFVGRPNLELIDSKTGKVEFESIKTKKK